MTIGKKLKALRRQRGLTQEQLAEKLSVSRQALSKWESDASIPDTENIIRLAQLFDVTTDHLLLDAPLAPAEPPAPKRRTPRIIGWCTVGFAALNAFVLALLNSFFPTDYLVPEGGDVYMIAATGFEGFIRTHNLEWLLIVIVLALLAGILLLILDHRQTKNTARPSA